MKKFVLLFLFVAQANANDRIFCQVRGPCQPGFRCPVNYTPCKDGLGSFAVSGKACMNVNNDEELEDLETAAIEKANRGANSLCSTGLATPVGEPSFTFNECRAASGLEVIAVRHYECQ